MRKLVFPTVRRYTLDSGPRSYSRPCGLWMASALGVPEQDMVQD